ncbi:oligosaccharide flippase family protein [Pandoraea sp. XY-2]|uniref:oligosaccharide flippase family protein n=1 Tax=Pandoraea sp. XY-2 TaxID=2518599 RepID=UPI00101B09D2|nr:oligosaccharide flippase family protein [Pandoraea sp. XY-2]QBC33472.1 hypothetical protein DRB87_22005 [Pandoraea sp. XY-2]
MFKHAKNLMALAAIQGSNAALPLLVFPFALGVLGAKHYADLVFTEAISVITIAVVLYSFEIDGVAQVAGLKHENDSERISRVFSRIFIMRLILFAVIAPLFVSGLALYRHELLVSALWWMLVPLSYALAPTWLYQGLQMNLPPAILTFSTRAVAVGLIFWLLKTPDDYLLVPKVMGGMYLVGAVLMVAFAVFGLGIRLVPVSYSEMRDMLVSGKEIFVGNVGVALYRDSNVLLLGLLGYQGAALAAYSLAEKLVKAVQAGVRPLNQLFFPRAVLVSRAAQAPDPATWRRLFALTWPQGVALIGGWCALSFVLPLLSDHVPALRNIKDGRTVVLFISIMSFATLFGVANFMFGSAGLNILGQRKYLLHAILTAGCTSVVTTLVLGHFYGAIGAAVSLTLSEGMLFLLIVGRYFGLQIRKQKAHS